MKRILFLTELALLVLLFVFVFGSDKRVRTVPFEAVPETSSPSDRPDAAREKEDPSLLLLASVPGFTLQEGGDGTVLIPLIPESGLTLTVSSGSSVEKERLDGNTFLVTVRKGGRFRSLKLTETGIPVAYLELSGREVGTDSSPIGDENAPAAFRALSFDESGCPVVSSGPVQIKRHGGSSRNYQKKSYTVTNVTNRGHATERSLLGLPADRKFTLNSMYEDDIKLRDALSLELYRDLVSSSETVRDGVPGFRYCELYINDVYWGLYGLQQTVSPVSAMLSEGDGLIKLKNHIRFDLPDSVQKERLKTMQESAGGNVLGLFIDSFRRLSAGDAEALSLFDTDSLSLLTLFIHTTCSVDNRSKNLSVTWHADREKFSFSVYDTDQTFGLVWEPSSALGVCFRPETARIDMTTGNEDTVQPANVFLAFGERVTRPLAELYFSLRGSVLSEERLIARAHGIYGTLVNGGAFSRERTRWPGGAYSDSLDGFDAFVRERFAYCDGYFSEYLTESLPAA